MKHMKKIMAAVILMLTVAVLCPVGASAATRKPTIGTNNQNAVLKKVSNGVYKLTVLKDVDEVALYARSTNSDVTCDAQTVWKSSNKKVVTVDKGTMKLVKAGKATVSCTYKKKTTTIQVTIKKTSDSTFFAKGNNWSATVNGDKIRLCLYSNPSTGYAWAWAKCITGLGLKYEGYVQDYSGDIPCDGMGGTEIFTITAGKAGNLSLPMTYCKAYGIKSSESFSYMLKVKVVKVDGKLQITKVSFRRVK